MGNLLLPVCFKPKCMSTNDDDHDSQLPPPPPPQRVLLSEVTASPASFLQSGSLVDVHVFCFKEVATVTRNFSCELLGVGGFGPVYKGLIQDGLRPGLMAQPVAVKVLDLGRSTQGHTEWLAEVVLLGQLKHPNLVNLIGYCCEEKERILVYEFLEGGNLHTQLFKTTISSLPLIMPWLTRLKIALGAATALAFLHHQETPAPVIYRDFKSSNILLDSEYNAKLSDFGLATDGPQDGHTHVSIHVMGTKGYVAPEYIMTGHLTTMSDVFSFGVVLLELLTGRRCVEKIGEGREKKVLVDWARPRLKDPCKLHGIMDPRLEGQYSTNGARKLATLTHKCLSINPKSRPSMSFVVRALEPLLEDLNDIPIGPFVYVCCSESSPTQKS